MQKNFHRNIGYTIPLSCFITKQISSLIICGRNIFATHMVHYNFKAMPICVGMVENCGAVAAYAKKYRTSYRDADISEIHIYLTNEAPF